MQITLVKKQACVSASEKKNCSLYDGVISSSANTHSKTLYFKF